VLDIRMPDLSGEQVLTAVRHSPTLWQTPVLVISGHLEDLGDQPLGLNVVGRLAKPVDVLTFLRAVERALTAQPQ
jgi:CheY-like chemotaxis protein